MNSSDVVDRLARIEWKSRENAFSIPQEMASMRFLHELLGAERFMPLAGGWAANYSTIALMLDFLRTRTRPLVYEFGGGVSTVWFAKYMEKFGGHLISVEHDQKYLLSTRETLEAMGLEKYVTLVLAPITGESGQLWYDESVIPRKSGVDLVFVDGPVATLDSHVRRRALPFIEPELCDGALIILDDANRAEERDIAAQWVSDFDLREYRLQVSGAAAFVAPSRAKPAHRQASGPRRVAHDQVVSYLNQGPFKSFMEENGFEVVDARKETLRRSDLLVVDSSLLARKYSGQVDTILVFTNESRFSIDLPRESRINGSRVVNFSVHLGDFPDLWHIYAKYQMVEPVVPDWSSRRRACMFATNKSSSAAGMAAAVATRFDLTEARHSIAVDGVKHGILDVYGRGWGDLEVKGEHRMGHDGRTPTEIKRDIAAQYCVQFALENTLLPAYATEKFWQAGDAGCIPVYMGHSWLDERVPSELYIDLRHIESLEHLWQVVRGVETDPTSIERVREIQRLTAQVRAQANSGAAYLRWKRLLLDAVKTTMEQDDFLSGSPWCMQSDPTP